MFISYRNQIICQMKVFFQEKKYIYGCNCKEKSSFVFLHNLDKFLIVFNKTKNQLKRKNSSPSEICLRTDALESKIHPVPSYHLDGTFKVWRMQLFEKIPSFVVPLKEDIALTMIIIKVYEFIMSQCIILTTKILSPMVAISMSGRFSGI